MEWFFCFGKVFVRYFLNFCLDFVILGGIGEIVCVVVVEEIGIIVCMLVVFKIFCSGFGDVLFDLYGISVKYIIKIVKSF